MRKCDKTRTRRMAGPLWFGCYRHGWEQDLHTSVDEYANFMLIPGGGGGGNNAPFLPPPAHSTVRFSSFFFSVLFFKFFFFSFRFFVLFMCLVAPFFLLPSFFFVKQLCSLRWCFSCSLWLVVVPLRVLFFCFFLFFLLRNTCIWHRPATVISARPQHLAHAPQHDANDPRI